MNSSEESKNASPPHGSEPGGPEPTHDGDRHDGSSGNCLLCWLAGEMERRLDRHSEVFEHLAGAQREVLQAVRSFVDTELGSLEDRLRRYRERRDAPPRVTHIDVD